MSTTTSFASGLGSGISCSCSGAAGSIRRMDRIREPYTGCELRVASFEHNSLWFATRNPQLATVLRAGTRNNTPARRDRLTAVDIRSITAPNPGPFTLDGTRSYLPGGP